MNDLKELKNYLNEINCSYDENEIMSEHTTFKIGGPADVFIKPSNEKLLADVVKKCRECNIKFFILGSGSNVLFDDFGFGGAVIYTGGLGEMQINGVNEIYSESGVKLSRVCSMALDNNLQGMEFCWGIPGTVGGAVFMNAGAYGGEIKQIIKSCNFIDENGDFRSVDVDEMHLGYRSSLFQKNRGIITSAVFNLSIGDSAEIRSKMDELFSRRKEKQPLEYPSAGSVFKRPEGYYAGTLIQECGLKGATVGGAQVSEKHSGFIINIGGATARDVQKLIELIQNTVYEKTGVELEKELCVVV